MEMSKSLVDMNAVYRFRLGGFVSLSSTTGVIDTYFAADPSASGLNFAEWSSLSTLFSEFRLESLSITITPNHFSTGTNIPILGVCSNLGTSIAAGSYAVIADNADSQIVNPNMSNPTGYHHIMRGTGLNWSVVSTPTVSPYAGAPGCIQVYGSQGSSTTADLYKVLVVGIYQFRSRV